MLSAALPEEVLSFETAELLPLFLRDGGVEDEAKLGLVESAVSTVALLILLCVLLAFCLFCSLLKPSGFVVLRL